MKLTVIFLMTALLCGCQSTSHGSDMGGQVDVLIVNPISDQYPESVMLWSEFILDRFPEASITALSGQITPDELIDALSLMNGEGRNIFIYHGHGGNSYAWLGQGRKLAYSDIIGNLAAKGKPFIAVIDACYSGTAKDALEDAGSSLVADAMLITSSGRNEQSYGMVKEDNMQGSSSWLLRSLLLFGDIPSELSGYENVQHPEVWTFDAKTRNMTKIELEEPEPKTYDKRYMKLF